MISTDIDYPSGLPCWLFADYGLQAGEPMLRSEMASGRARQRRMFTSVPSRASVSAIMTDQQAMLFEAWHRWTLRDGAAWFNAPLKTPIGFQDYICRFTSMFSGPALVAPGLWRYTASLELFERPTLPQGWELFPEFILDADIFDVAMNSKWPEAS